MHDFRCDIVGIVPEQVVDEASFVTPESVLADPAQQQLAVPKEHIAILEAGILSLFGGVLLPGFKVDQNSRVLVRPKQRADDLLPSPQTGWLQDTWGRQTDRLICVTEP